MSLQHTEVLQFVTSFRYWDIGENRLKLNIFTTQQQIFAGAKRIYWCIYNGTSD